VAGNVVDALWANIGYCGLAVFSSPNWLDEQEKALMAVLTFLAVSLAYTNFYDRRPLGPGFEMSHPGSQSEA